MIMTKIRLGSSGCGNEEVVEGFGGGGVARVRRARVLSLPAIAFRASWAWTDRAGAGRPRPCGRLAVLGLVGPPALQQGRQLLPEEGEELM